MCAYKVASYRKRYCELNYVTHMLRNDTNRADYRERLQCITAGHIVRIILDVLAPYGLFSLYRAIASIREMPSMPYVASNRPWAIGHWWSGELWANRLSRQHLINLSILAPFPSRLSSYWLLFALLGASALESIIVQRCVKASMYSVARKFP